MTVHGPNDKPILTETKQRQGDYVFTAQSVGEYRFCFANEHSTFTAEKMVDLEIAVENESRSASLPQKPGTTPEQTSALEDVVFKVSSQLSTINRMQKYFRTRENRNFSTVRSTEGRILRFSLVEVGMMVGMAGLQVMVVRFFFQGARKGMYLIEVLLDEKERLMFVLGRLCLRFVRYSGRYAMLLCGGLQRAELDLDRNAVLPSKQFNARNGGFTRGQKHLG